MAYIGQDATFSIADSFRACSVALRGAAALIIATGATHAFAEDAWKTSPFHGVPNAATGKTIPCNCRYKGSELPLGAEICLNTPNGTVLARCDLHLNNTTWAPTTTPCQLNSSNRLKSPFQSTWVSG
jgi:hypothetical protein